MSETVVYVEKPFDVTVEDLYQLVDPKNPELYAKMGKTSGLAKLLKTNLDSGLISSDHSDFTKRRQVFGTNSLPEPISKTLLQFMAESLKDRTLQVLIGAALIEVAVGIYEVRFAPKTDPFALIDGCAIIVAGSISDYRKQAQFRSLSDYSKNLAECRVFRDYMTVQIHPADLVVGDIALLQVGDVVPADGILIQGFSVEADESTLTGEPISVQKDTDHEPFILSGTRIVNGVGKMLVIGTGVNSVNGRSILALEVEPEETPLQEKLGRIADLIAKYGAAAAISMMVILLIIYCSISIRFKTSFEIGQDIIRLFITAVTIVVVAVPEGLPLAVTLSLAHATMQMLKDNNLVRHLSACETMGNATTICSDKTGTLTLNKMTVVRGMVANVSFDRETDAKFVSNDILRWFALNVNINSSAEEVANAKGEIELRGSKTEIAILDLTKKWGLPYQEDRKKILETIEIVPFSSANKSMRTTIRLAAEPFVHKLFGFSDQDHIEWVFIKGASEIVLGMCTSYLDQNGMHAIDAAALESFEKTITEYANNALRTIGVAFRPKNNFDDNSFIFISLLGILDPVRPEVPNAVKQCQNAGIFVRMVTGDNINTAKAIAKECGLLTDEGIAMEGPVFRKLSDAAREEILPKLQVLARSSPLDKQILVNGLKKIGHVVAVTGDGTNDAPALTSADVGFSMGIAGTEVAKEASDIILMDDNFASLVKAVLWGRAVFDAIRKFLQFQLTVNVSAVVIAIVTSFYTTFGPTRTPESALSAIQLLWVNLVMDTFAALALATDPPTPDLLNRLPSKRSDHIISSFMFNMIMGQAAYQILVCFLIYFGGSAWLGVDELYIRTLLFNCFVFCQIFNEINCRSINRSLNVFRGIQNNYYFIVIFFITIVGQTLIVEFAGIVFKTNPEGLNGIGWLISILVGFGSLPLGFLIRLLPETQWSFLQGESLPAMDKQEVPKSPTSERSRALWNSAIRKTRMQIRVVNLFQTPYKHSPSTVQRKSVSQGQNSNLWNQVAESFSTRRVDYTTLQLADPSRIRQGHPK